MSYNTKKEHDYGLHNRVDQNCSQCYIEKICLKIKQLKKIDNGITDLLNELYEHFPDEFTEFIQENIDNIPL